MVSIKLPFAYDPKNNKYWHISEKIPDEIDLVCPYCSSSVSSKKGKVRRHHFFHLNSTDECNINPETVLHEGAKIYIYKNLQKNKNFKLKFKPDNILENEIKSLFKDLGVQEFIFNSNDIIPVGTLEHYLEHKIKNKIPDIFSKCKSKDTGKIKSFAWEVYVTHFSEEDKIKFYSKNNISFIEIEPEEDGLYDYIFEVKNYEGISLFDDLSKVKKRLFSSYKKEMFNEYKSKLDSLYSENLERNLTKKILKSLDKKINYTDLYKKNQEEFISFQLIQFLSTTFKPKLRNKYKKNNKVFKLKCKKLEYFNHKNGTTIKFNEKYSLDSQFFMLGLIYKKLSDMGMGKAILNKKRNIVGYKLSYPSIKKLEIEERTLLLNGETECTTTSVMYSQGKRSKKGNPYLVMNNSFVKSPITQLMNILKFFKSEFQLVIYLKENKYNKKYITSLKIKGLVQEIALAKFITKKYFATAIKNLRSEYQ